MEDPTRIEHLKLPRGPVIIAMKGHGCSGKTTLGIEMARSLILRGYDCSFQSYEDILVPIQKTLGASLTDRGLCEDVAYRILWRVASAYILMNNRGRPQAVVLDSPLPSRGHLDQVMNLGGMFTSREPFVLVVDCQARDKVMWRQWLETRVASAASVASDDPSSSSSSSSSPLPWEEIQREISDHKEYHTDGALCLTIDTTDSAKSTQDHAEDVIRLMSSYYLNPVEPRKIKFGVAEFFLRPTSGDEVIKSGECLVCYGQSGVLYSYDGMPYGHADFKIHIHPKCAELPYKLKHSCHEHHLKLMIIFIVFTCGACGTYGNVAAYFCKECNVYFHVTCTLYLEARVIHKRHWHPMVLCTIPKDESNEYYCEICETERCPDLWAYYCKGCEYEAHISCVNPQIKPSNPVMLLPENWGKGRRASTLKWYNELPDLRNPILSEISSSLIAWEPVDEPDSDSDLE